MEKSVNKVELSGFSGMEPEVTTFKNGERRMRFTLATNRSYKNKNGEWMRDTTWHNIVMLDKNVEKALLHIRKGTFVKLTGAISNRQYTDDKGVKHFINEIIAYTFEAVEIEKKAAATEAV